MGVLQLLGFYCVGQDVLIQNSQRQRICPVCIGWTEAFNEVPLNTFLGRGDKSFSLPPRHGGGIIMAVYNEPFYCVKIKMADNVLREFQDEEYSSTVAANMVNYHGYCPT